MLCHKSALWWNHPPWDSCHLPYSAQASLSRMARFSVGFSETCFCRVPNDPPLWVDMLSPIRQACSVWAGVYRSRFHLFTGTLPHGPHCRHGSYP